MRIHEQFQCHATKIHRECPIAALKVAFEVLADLRNLLSYLLAV
jgi:hypothetical protein